jgi:small subunit ribosomal protein S10
MPKGRIRVRLKAYDGRVLDAACQTILDAAIRTGAKISGPIPLPTDKSLITVGQSPFTDKDSQEHFQITVHKRLIDIIEPTDKTIDTLMHLELPAGVDIEIKM